MSSTDLNRNAESAPAPAVNHRAAVGNPVLDLVMLAISPGRAVTSPTAAWIKRRPILALITLAYGLTWLGLLPLIREPGIVAQADWSHARNPAVLVYAFLGVLGCLWASVIVAGATGGLDARRELLRGYLRWRVGVQWYAVVLLLPALIFGVAVGVYAAWMRSMPVLSLPALLPTALISSYAVLLGRYVIGNFEEICWRASLLPRLQARFSALAASVLVGLVQGFWHLPFAFVRGHYVQLIGLPAMTLQSIAMSIVFAWVYNSTRGSLLLAALFHAAYDALSQFQGSDLRLLYLNIAVWWLVALIVVAVFGWRRLSRTAGSQFAGAVRPDEQ